MEVILLEKITKLGDLGDKVHVKSGYGRNYLFPQKKAIPASEENLLKYESRKIELQAIADEKLAEAVKRSELVEALDITLAAKAGEEGKLFGSIGTRDIADACVAEGVSVQKSEIRLPHGAIRELGEYEIVVTLHSEVNATLKLGVVDEQ